MANNPISMSKLRHLLHLYAQGRSKLKISEQTGLSRNTVKKYLNQFESSGLSFAEINQLSDKDIEDLFIRPEENPMSDKLKKLVVLFPSIEKDLKKRGATRRR
ncbi:MAG: helix-turn-helix domain-containing protein [Flavobacteriales bacterium]